jgi:hypothetical protein
VVVEAFNVSSKIIRKPIESGTVVTGLGAMMQDWLTTALGRSRIATRRWRADMILQANSTETPRGTMLVYTRGRDKIF